MSAETTMRAGADAEAPVLHMDKARLRRLVGLRREITRTKRRIAAYFGVSAAVLLGGGDGADGADGADGELHAFLALYAKLSDEDRAALRAYMRKLLESGG